MNAIELNNYILKSFSNIPTIIKIVVIVIIIFNFYVIYIKNYMYPTIYTWWDEYDGNQFNKYFDMTIFLIAFHSSLLYQILSLTTQSFVSNMSRTQIVFLATIVLPNIKTRNEKDGFNGHCLPRHLCKSIKFIQGEDDLFDKYLSATKSDPVLPAVFDEAGEIIRDKETGKKGVYPDNTNYYGWLQKCQEWTGRLWVNKQNGLKFPYDSNTSTDDVQIIVTEWFNIKKHPDNFFARYGITPDSPLIIGFCNGAYNDPNTGLIFNVQSAITLLGGTDENTAGGWLGYTLGSSTLSSDQMLNYIRTTYMANSKPPPQVPIKKKRDCGAKTMTEGVTAGASGALMGAFMGPTPAGAVMAAGGFLSGFIGTIASKCFFKS